MGKKCPFDPTVQLTEAPEWEAFHGTYLCAGGIDVADRVHQAVVSSRAFIIYSA